MDVETVSDAANIVEMANDVVEEGDVVGATVVVHLPRVARLLLLPLRLQFHQLKCITARQSLAQVFWSNDRRKSRRCILWTQ